MRQRKNVLNMTPTEIAAFRDAVQALQDLPDLARNYRHFAQIHVDSCIHNYELFLPWHRAFILDYENALRQVSGQDVTLPYWDWIGEPAIPDIFNNPPLLHGRDPGASDQRLPTADEINKALLMSDFYVFGGSQLVVGYPTQPGQLDNLHGYVHLWVGGDMGDVFTFRSAYDPIFWSHHSNVDRLWAQWQQTFGNSGPADTTSLLPGLDIRRTAADVLDIGPNGLGYEYVAAAFEIPLKKVPLSKRERFNIDISCVRTQFTRAEVRFINLHQVHESSLPVAIDVVMPDLRISPRLSLFGLHSMHGERVGQNAMGAHPTSISPILDVTEGVLRAQKSKCQVEVGVELIAASGLQNSACGIGVDRLQLILRP
jgi:hypothetical protein